MADIADLTARSPGALFGTRRDALKEVLRRQSDPAFEGCLNRIRETRSGRFTVFSMPVEVAVDLMIDGPPGFSWFGSRRRAAS